MKQILPQTQLFSFVAPTQSYSNAKIYRQSKYSVSLEYKDKILLFNTLTREMLVLNKKQYKDIKKNDFLLQELVKKYFWVENDFDEKKLSQQIVNFAKMFYKNDCITQFTIFSTMNCNARCFYCFEHGAKRYHMTNEIAYNVANFIIKKSCSKKVKLLWFGGEPLCNINAIDIICKSLKEANVEFKSKMISNGYLFDEKTAKHSKNNWNMNLIQITLDGTSEVYNRIKNYIYKPNNDAFDKVINNIESALKNDIRVLIRLNMDKNNSNDLFELTRFLCEKFKGYEDLLSIYVWMLYDDRGAVKRIKSNEERWNLTENLLNLENYIYGCGFGLKGSPQKNIAVNMCVADSDSTMTILPDGKIGKCDHYSDSKFIGDINSEIIDNQMVNMWKELREEVELCERCSLYPQCIKLKNCPELGTFNCDLPEQRRLLEKLYHQMRYAYDKYIENNTQSGDGSD